MTVLEGPTTVGTQIHKPDHACVCCCVEVACCTQCTSPSAQVSCTVVNPAQSTTFSWASLQNPFAAQDLLPTVWGTPVASEVCEECSSTQNCLNHKKYQVPHGHLLANSQHVYGVSQEAMHVTGGSQPGLMATYYASNASKPPDIQAAMDLSVQ